MDAPDPKLGSVILAPESAKIVRAFGAELHFHLTGAQTEKRFALATILTPPNVGPPAHYHLNEDECFVVQEGRISFLSGGEWKEVGPGETVYTPRGTIHAYKNCGDTISKMLFTAWPAGFDVFFERCEKEFLRPGGPDMQRIFEISSEHGIYYV